MMVLPFWHVYCWIRYRCRNHACFRTAEKMPTGKGGNGMSEIKKIMVAVDVSDYSLPSLRYACNLAEVTGAKLLLVTVFNIHDISTAQNLLAAYDLSVYQGHIEERLSDRRRWLDDLEKQAGAQTVTADKSVRVGVPYQELLAAIDNDRPDLLVISTKGRSNLADTILGSCAQKMFRRCPIPLLSLRPQKKSPRE